MVMATAPSATAASGPWESASRPQGPGGPARAYRYRLALGRAYRYRYRPARAHRYRSERAVTGSFLVSPFYFNFS